jgi:hypothetical protein
MLSNRPFDVPIAEMAEISHRSRRIASGELRRRGGLLSFIVVVARRAIERADHPLRSGQQVPDPGVLGLPGS